MLLSSSIPVFAADREILVNPLIFVSVDSSTNAVQATIDGNYIDVKVPVFLGVSADNKLINRYLSGTLTLPYNFNTLFAFQNSAGNNIVPAYFERVADNIQISRTDTNPFRLFFDNAVFNMHSSSTGSPIFGYFHFAFNTTADNTLVIVSGNNYVTLTPSTNGLYQSVYEMGFVDATIQAINNATDVDEMLTILNNIDANTGFLPEILTTLKAQHESLYNLVQALWSTEGTILQVNQSTYNAISRILQILEAQYSEHATQVESDAAEVESNLSDLAHDMEIVKPDPVDVGNIAEDVIQAVDQSYNNAIIGPLINSRMIGIMLIAASLAVLSYLLYGGQ